MSKVGRNDLCPCGSGKKYKKCCLGKPFPEAAQNSLKRGLENLWSYEKVNGMSTEEIIGKLQSIGISFEKETFLEDVEKFYSAQQLSESWFEDKLIIHNMRRSIAESYLQLKKIDEAKNELDSLVRDYPDNPWSYIAYGDMYWFAEDVIKDSSKAKEMYERELLVAKDKYDKKVIEERLEDLKD
jgi:tetratricopeptide (TPR) repeat protein